METIILFWVSRGYYGDPFRIYLLTTSKLSFPEVSFHQSSGPVWGHWIEYCSFSVYMSVRRKQGGRGFGFCLGLVVQVPSDLQVWGFI